MNIKTNKLVVVVLGFYVPPTAKFIQDLGLKSHLKD